jgi:hypothetical protein
VNIPGGACPISLSYRAISVVFANGQMLLLKGNLLGAQFSLREEQRGAKRSLQ